MCRVSSAEWWLHQVAAAAVVQAFVCTDLPGAEGGLPFITQWRPQALQQYMGWSMTAEMSGAVGSAETRAGLRSCSFQQQVGAAARAQQQHVQSLGEAPPSQEERGELGAGCSGGPNFSEQQQRKTERTSGDFCPTCRSWCGAVAKVLVSVRVSLFPFVADRRTN